LHYGFLTLKSAYADPAFVRAAVLKGVQKAHPASDFFKFAKRFEGYKVAASDPVIIIFASLSTYSEARKVQEIFRAGSLGDVGCQKGERQGLGARRRATGEFIFGLFGS
jgi:hypothetical protein